MARPLLLAAAVLLVASPAIAQTTGQPSGPAKPTEPTTGPAIDPTADAQLRRMSDYLASLRSLELDAAAVDQKVTTDGQKIQFMIDQHVSLRRPDKMRVERRGPLADATFRYDGRRFTVYGKRSGYYAMAPAPPQLDKAIDAARDRYGIDAPGGDLLVSDVYGDLMKDVESGREVGLESIDGVLCHHLAYRGKDVDWQIWIQDGPQPVPRRYVITSKNETGQPEFSTTLSHWKTNVTLPDAMFTFTPPPGAREITFQPVGPLHGAR
jgi:hypothetical protein